MGKELAMRRAFRLALIGMLPVVAAEAASDSEMIFARESAFAAAIDRQDAKAFEALVTRDIRIVRSDFIYFVASNVVNRLASLYELSPGSSFSRTAETIQVSRSGEYAFITGTQRISKGDTESSSRYLSIWRYIPEFEKEWSLAFDAPLEVWKELDDKLVVDPVEVAPGLLVVALGPPPALLPES
ncbi:MAG: DUF4440 domain-containing protein [Thermoanaerobaculia bacterium]